MTEGNNITPIQLSAGTANVEKSAPTITLGANPAPVSRQSDTIELTRANQAKLESSIRLREAEIAQQQAAKKAPPPLPLGESRPSLLKSADGELIVKNYNFVTGEVSYEPGDFNIKDLIARSDVAAVAFKQSVDVEA